jgi:hypothetical protein
VEGTESTTYESSLFFWMSARNAKGAPCAGRDKEEALDLGRNGAGGGGGAPEEGNGGGSGALD